jgi:hypothetical protein
MRVKEKKFDIVKDEEAMPDDLEELDLSESYNETKIVLMLRDPLWAFAYWDLGQSDIDAIERIAGSRLYLRIFQVVEGEDGSRKKQAPFEIPVKVTDRSWYINLPTTGSCYVLELIMKSRQKEKVLCMSNTIASPEISINPTDDSSIDESFYSILAVSGLQESRDFSEKGGIPQRIISLLDTQYLHLQG